MNYVLAPSILSADFTKLGDQIKEIEQAGAKYLHFDVMDGHFVENISFGNPVLHSIKSHTSLTIDVHLMVEEPIRYIEAFAKAGADIITVHYEACRDLPSTLKEIHRFGLKAGLTIKPETTLELIIPYLTMVDMVLIMSVSPGYGGQAFIPDSLNKIRSLKEIIDRNHLEVDIEVDGGIHLKELQEVLDAGANVIVAGSAIFGGDIESNVKAFLEIIGKYT